MARRGITACDAALTPPTHPANLHTCKLSALALSACARSHFESLRIAHTWNVMWAVCAFAGLLSLSLALCTSSRTQFGLLKFWGVAREADFDLKLAPIRFGNAFVQWTIDDEWPAAGSIFRLRCFIHNLIGSSFVKGEMQLWKLCNMPLAQKTVHRDIPIDYVVYFYTLNSLNKPDFFQRVCFRNAKNIRFHKKLSIKLYGAIQK